MLGVVVQHFVKTLTEYEIKNDKELSWIRVLSRHVTGDIIWAVWPWTRFAWRETSTLPPGMYKWEYSCRLHNHTAHTDGSSSKSCINPILAAMIWLCHPLKLCLCLMFVNSRKKKIFIWPLRFFSAHYVFFPRPPVASSVFGPNIFHRLLVLNKTSWMYILSLRRRRVLQSHTKQQEKL